VKLIFTTLFGIVVYFGTATVDISNRLLMAGLIIAYIGMVSTGLGKIKFDLLLHTNAKYLLAALPVMVVSFGFHNLIPSLTSYVKGDLHAMRWIVLGGSFLTLLINLIWQTLVLGVVPYLGPDGILASFTGEKEASYALEKVLQSSAVAKFSQGFAFFAIVTSFLAQALSIMHFIADGLKVSPNRKNSIWLCLLAIAPPLIFVLSIPKLFFAALNFAGGICAVLLFGVLPAVLVWNGRYRKDRSADFRIGGGKLALVLTIGVSVFILVYEITKIFI